MRLPPEQRARVKSVEGNRTASSRKYGAILSPLRRAFKWKLADARTLKLQY
jgi:hypothetical protein